MHEKQIRTITALVADALAEQKLPFAKDRKAALELLRTPGWAEELSQLLPIRRRLECGEVLEVCTPILPKLSPQGALVLMGHGSVHYANASYCELQMKFWSAGHRNVFVTTVEGYPNFEETLGFMKGGDYRDVLVYPLMLVAGDHANNDMAGDEDDSLKSVLTAAGYDVNCIVRGMGECPHFRELFLDHITEAVRRSEVECEDRGCGAPVGKTEVLVDHL